MHEFRSFVGQSDTWILPLFPFLPVTWMALMIRFLSQHLLSHQNLYLKMLPFFSFFLFFLFVLFFILRCGRWCRMRLSDHVWPICISLWKAIVCSVQISAIKWADCQFPNYLLVLFICQHVYNYHLTPCYFSPKQSYIFTFCKLL